MLRASWDILELGWGVLGLSWGVLGLIRGISTPIAGGGGGGRGHSSVAAEQGNNPHSPHHPSSSQYPQCSPSTVCPGTRRSTWKETRPPPAEKPRLRRCRVPPPAARSRGCPRSPPGAPGTSVCWQRRLPEDAGALPGAGALRAPLARPRLVPARSFGCLMETGFKGKAARTFPKKIINGLCVGFLRPHTIPKV